MSLRHATQQLIGDLLDGALVGGAAIAKLSALDIEQLLPSQLAGAVEAVMARSVPFPAFPEAVDCCGTGGDGLQTLNISTAVAIVAASCGVVVAKHGNRAVTSTSGSADVLEALGVNTALAPEQLATVLREVGLAFLFAPTFHPGFARVASIRKAIGKRTIFNLLGPLCNPARVQRQLIGVYAPYLCGLVAEAAQLLGLQQVMAVHGDDGGDEISISTPTHIGLLQDGRLSFIAARPQDAGLQPQPLAAIRGGHAAENAEAMRAMLGGTKGAYADAVAINTAAVLMLAGKATNLYDGALMAHNAIALGKARKKLEQLVEATHSV